MYTLPIQYGLRFGGMKKNGVPPVFTYLQSRFVAMAGFTIPTSSRLAIVFIPLSNGAGSSDALTKKL
jgi:hypothetical protein